MADGLDPTKILYCLFDPTSPDSVATAWVVRHVCQRDAISLELAENEPNAAMPPDFFDRHVVVAGVRWGIDVINLNDIANDKGVACDGRDRDRAACPTR